ncbi:diadenosine tetraphosphate hydrolase [Candidatus Woesearchaeota archaeon]|nr:MAG: diadenosine tetraphosphate hydrolase [Candidatus Woesearchaeota archaeon ex4484_78]RLE46526.1 MAG: diadenosine tetraphosphate hydrolase [Candidatus Woesearchaeota archaeon]
MKEASAGVIIATEKPRKYLLLHYGAGHWDFAKGHIEKGETPKQAALREVKEETGIKNLKILPRFKKEIHYFFRKNNKLISKTVIFYLGLTKTKKIKLSYEHTDYKWLPYEAALEQLTYKTAKQVLTAANKFLENQK